tara:strand:+ start:933 stop:1049 length:117 start_codon:yes stop_codon:yes gene_type:complete
MMESEYCNQEDGSPGYQNQLEEQREIQKLKRRNKDKGD